MVALATSSLSLPPPPPPKRELLVHRCVAPECAEALPERAIKLRVAGTCWPVPPPVHVASRGHVQENTSHVEGLVLAPVTQREHKAPKKKRHARSAEEHATSLSAASGHAVRDPQRLSPCWRTPLLIHNDKVHLFAKSRMINGRPFLSWSAPNRGLQVTPLAMALISAPLP